MRAPRPHQRRREYPLAGALKAPDDKHDLARFGRLLKHARGPPEDILEMLVVATADDVADMLAQKAPIAGRRFDRKPSPQIPTCLRRLVGRIEHNAIRIGAAIPVI